MYLVGWKKYFYKKIEGNLEKIINGAHDHIFLHPINRLHYQAMETNGCITLT